MGLSLSRPDDLVPTKFPAVTWDGTATAAALEQLRSHVVAQAETAMQWYVKKREFKRFFGRFVRLAAMLITAAAGAIPIIVQIFGRDGKPAFDPSWASIALALAALLVSFDYFFGFTTAWCRYLEAQQRIARAMDEFQFDWELLRAGWAGQNPGPEPTRAALLRLKEATLRVDQLVEDETAVWVAEFKSALKVIDDAARSRSDVTPLPAVNVTLTNGGSVDGAWQLTVDDGTPVSQQGTRAALVGLRPGPHKFTAQGTIAGVDKRDEISAEVPAKGIASVELTLQ